MRINLRRYITIRFENSILVNKTSDRGSAILLALWISTCIQESNGLGVLTYVPFKDTVPVNVTCLTPLEGYVLVFFNHFISALYITHSSMLSDTSNFSNSPHMFRGGFQGHKHGCDSGKTIKLLEIKTCARNTCTNAAISRFFS